MYTRCRDLNGVRPTLPTRPTALTRLQRDDRHPARDIQGRRVLLQASRRFCAPDWTQEGLGRPVHVGQVDGNGLKVVVPCISIGQGGSAAHLLGLRNGRAYWSEVLCAMRGAHRDRAECRDAKARLDPLLRPGGVDGARRGAGSGGVPASSAALLRDLRARAGRAWRDAREVHRRCRALRLRHSCRA